MNTKLNFKNLVIIFLVGLLLIIIGGLFVYLLKDKEIDNGNDDGIKSLYTYQTSDNRFVFKIVEKENQDAYNNAKIRYGESFDGTISQYVKFYGYINSRVFAIDAVVEDENYALYSIIGLPTEESGHKILVNKKNSTIEVSNEDLNKIDNSCLMNGFCGFQSQPSYLKSNSGYYFINDDNGLITVYTSEWKRIGFIDKVSNIQLDDDGGINLYQDVEKKSCNGKYCDYEGIGSTIKYNINGEKIN